MSVACFSSYTNSDGIDGLPPFIFAACTTICILGLEISSLIFFILDYDKLKDIIKIGYYIHLIIYPCVVFSCSLNYIRDKCKE